MILLSSFQNGFSRLLIFHLLAWISGQGAGPLGPRGDKGEKGQKGERDASYVSVTFPKGIINYKHFDTRQHYKFI